MSRNRGQVRIFVQSFQLKTPIPFNKYTDVVTLPRRMQSTPAGSDATLIGWGLDDSGDVPEILQKVDYFIPDHEECRRIHGTIHDSNICAYYPGGGKGQCSGDSGGPLLVDGEQVGVVSWSIKPCTVAPYPGVLTRVSHFIDWIADNTGLEF
jgi:trypsin